MTPKISLITAVVLGSALVLAAPAFAISEGGGRQQAAVHVSPDRADRAAAVDKARIHFAREDRALAAKREASPAVAQDPVRDDYSRTVTPDPVRDDYFRVDSPSVETPAATASSGRDIEWPQIGIGFAGGVLLAVALLLALRMPRVRQPAH